MTKKTENHAGKSKVKKSPAKIKPEQKKVKPKKNGKPADKDQLYQSLIDNDRDMYWRCDVKGRYIYLNKAWEKALGYAVNEMLNSPFSDFMDKKLSEKDMILFNKLLKENGSIIDYETVHKGKDGKKVYLSFNAYAIKDKDGKVCGIQGSARDISSLKEAKNKLIENEKKFHSLFDNASEGIALHEVIFDNKNIPVNYRLIDINPQYEIITNLKRADVIGKLATEVYGQTEAPYLEEFSRPAITGKPNYLETYYPPMKKHFSISIAPWGESGFATIFTDITGRKTAEQALEKTTERLRMINCELEQMLYVFSHDLRSPLINIEGFSNELNYSIGKIRYFIENLGLPEEKLSEINKIFNENIKDSFDFISLSTIKMDSLLKGFLKLFRLGMSKIEIKKIDMKKMINNIIKTLEYQIKKENIELIIEDVPDCCGDEMQINQVFSNLIENAVKYRDETRKSIIKISGFKKNKMSVYCVEDNGIGIMPEYQKKIFEIFYRLNPNYKEGEGLGLSIAEKIIKRHSGGFYVESIYGSGTKFFVELPDENICLL